MRLWSLHPKYLDAQGLTALWREALLAQAVLRGRTRGYRSHPQLARFRACRSPLAAIARYLRGVLAEAQRRGYAFDAAKIARARSRASLTVTTGQLDYEWAHLAAKLRRRSPERLRQWARVTRPEVHPLFRQRPGPRAAWERVPPPRAGRAR
jgi:hypothetical protein